MNEVGAGAVVVHQRHGVGPLAGGILLGGVPGQIILSVRDVYKRQERPDVTASGRSACQKRAVSFFDKLRPAGFRLRACVMLR